MELTHREASELRALATRGGRRRLDLCRCEGVRAVREVLNRAPAALRFVAVTPRGEAAFGAGLPPELTRHCSEAEFASLAATVNTQGVLALAAVPPEREGAVEGEFILALDRLSDPGNCGAIARTCFAAGGREIWRTAGSVDPWCDKALRAGLSAQFALGWRSFGSLAELKERAAAAGFGNFYIADPHEGENCFTTPDLYRRSVIVIGNEANGVTEVPPGSRRVRIPMPGDFESLNAAQAATVLLVEFVRRQSAAREEI